jgi:hypothetical protein
MYTLRLHKCATQRLPTYLLCFVSFHLFYTFSSFHLLYTFSSLQWVAVFAWIAVFALARLLPISPSGSIPGVTRGCRCSTIIFLHSSHAPLSHAFPDKLMKTSVQCSPVIRFAAPRLPKEAPYFYPGHPRIFALSSCLYCIAVRDLLLFPDPWSVPSLPMLHWLPLLGFFSPPSPPCLFPVLYFHHLAIEAPLLTILLPKVFVWFLATWF